MTTALSPQATPLADALRTALDADDPHALDALTDREPAGRRDRFATLLTIYDLHTGPLHRVGVAARHQHHPVVATLKNRCEEQWLDELTSLPSSSDLGPAPAPADVANAMRALAARDRLPAVYKWLSREAEWDQVVRFLALEGGPDAGFDDLVALCQVGLGGSPKMELATNYWDEMGDGDAAAVHTTLHDELVAAIGMPRIPLVEQPVSALARTALGGLLATNRWLQPEMLGALGLIELQAGPRCRLVLHAFDRCGAPAAAYPFYSVHAEVDPRHGKDWLEKAIVPTVEQAPEWGTRIVRGAQWRSEVNAAFLTDVATACGLGAAVGRTAPGGADTAAA
ncbi:MAG TPA: iron-containing redox enzyme family protein [Mycobacteriales bacterium]|nr:iron-containing redox enzyme family protein [Mycobacteriales bacterium]